jgi:hypothetical protein
MGTVEISISAGHNFKLENVLYVPSATVRLISVLTLNHSGHLTSHFNDNSFWLTNPSGATILCGMVYENRKLYGLPLQSACTVHGKIDASANVALDPMLGQSHTQAHYTSCKPDVETWHRQLGHCSIEMIIDMAWRGAVEGMAIDLSSSPPKCNACILGKQTRSPVPKVREGEKASRPLECVFVDLCGPMPCPSRSGCLYSMNVIDEFSSYVWSLPLRNKAEAATVLQHWHRAVENQSGNRLKILVTDNGKLVSKVMEAWCSHFSIDHQLTAPYTSAENGQAECLHRTILNKA